MVALADTPNISLTREIIMKEGGTYQEVAAFGDGNCALNAFALGLIHLIKNDQLRLTIEQQNKFLYYIRHMSLLVLNERLKLYRGQESKLQGNSYEDVADDLERFIELIEQNPALTFSDMATYIKQQTSRQAIAALHVALAPALRHIGVEAHIKSLKVWADENDPDNKDLFDNAYKLYDDGAWAGHEVLVHLAKDFFEINVVIYSEAIKQRVDMQEHMPDKPQIHVLQQREHYNFLLSESQMALGDGLIANLSAEHPVKKRQESVASRGFNLAAKIFTKPVMVAEDFADAVKVLREAGSQLMDALSQGVSPALEAEARALAAMSEKLRAALSQRLNLTDANLTNAGLKLALEKELLQADEVDTKDMSLDEALARVLQNEEIAAFTELHHKKLLLLPAARFNPLLGSGLFFPASQQRLPMGIAGGLLGLYPRGIFTPVTSIKGDLSKINGFPGGVPSIKGPK